MAHLVFVQLLEYIAPQAQPRCIGKVHLHHLFPNRDRQAEVGFAVPWHLSHLESPISTLIKDRPAEHHAHRDVARIERVKILGRCDIEVERAGKLQVDQHIVGEARDSHRGIHPQQRSHRAAPSLRGAKKVEQLLLLLGNIAPLGRLDLHLAAQREGVDRFLRGQIGDPQLQGNQGSGSMRHGLSGFDFEMQFRHGRALLLRRFGVFRSAKKWWISFHTSAPPESPRQCMRIKPTSR